AFCVATCAIIATRARVACRAALDCSAATIVHCLASPARDWACRPAAAAHCLAVDAAALPCSAANDVVAFAADFPACPALDMPDLMASPAYMARNRTPSNAGATRLPRSPNAVAPAAAPSTMPLPMFHAPATACAVFVAAV